MFIRQLHKDPTFTPAQRAYVLGFEPSPVRVGAILFSVFLLTAQGLTAAAFLGGVISGSVPAWATNLARFWAWTVSGLWALGVFASAIGVAVMAWRLSEAEGKLADSDEMESLRKKVDEQIPGMRRTARQYVLGTIGRLTVIGLIVGLGMAGYVVLPAILVAEWAAGVIVAMAAREAVAQGVKMLVPDMDAEPEIKSNFNQRVADIIASEAKAKGATRA